MQGADLSGVCRGDDSAKPESTHIGIPVPTGHGSSIDQPWSGVVTADGWKYVELRERTRLMFNLNDDPYEVG